MNLITAAPSRASFSLQLHDNGALVQREGRRTEFVLSGFFILPHYFNGKPRPARHNNLVVKASSKRASSKKRMKGKQDNSIAAPRNIKVEGSELDMKNSNRTADGIASSSLKEEANEIVEFGSAVGIANASAPPNRERVLKACVTTCSVLFMVGVLIQQATHFAAESGWSVPESMLSIKFSLEVEDLKVICGLILTISFSRQLLLLIWPEFLESSEAANKEVLKPLKPIDYAVVAILPAISEELLFRGALLPLCGLDWKGITVTGLFFGVLHLTGGRKNAFAIWASIVGMLYGLAYVCTGSVLVPMVAHGANNLIGATIWKLKQEGSQPGQ